MAIFEISLTDFNFPANLDEARRSFRFLATLRYITQEDKFETTQAVLPSLDSYWECEKSHQGKANFVRHSELPQFDMDKIDSWDTLLIRFKAKQLHSLQVRIIDIEKSGGWLDKIKDYVGPMIQAYLGTAKPVLTGAVPQKAAFLKDAFGDAIDDVDAFILAKLAGMKGQEFMLFKKSVATFPDAPGGPLTLEGKGEQGDYRIGLRVSVT